jgi:hypothetical protein
MKCYVSVCVLALIQLAIGYACVVTFGWVWCFAGGAVAIAASWLLAQSFAPARARKEWK